MKRWITISGWIFLAVFVSISRADTFKNRESGETFTGFVTQKTTAGKTLVYNSNESKMTPIILSDYEVTYDTQGRRDAVSLLQITQPEILLSEVVCQKAAAALVEASNKGPQAIIIQIDSPGGRSDYMKHIAMAASQTKNCPVYAYVSGENYGGAYASAAMIAMACDKIYISPTAGIGAVAPAFGDLIEGSYGNYLETYASGLLVTYSTFADSLAQQHNRPRLLAKALVDKSLSVVQVVDNNGSKAFVRQEDRLPTQTVLQTISTGMSAASLQNLSDVSPSDVVGKVIHLTAQQAVDYGLADGYVDSVRGIMSEMQMAEAQLTPIGGIDATLKKYLAARRNIAEGLLRIQQLEEEVATYNNQFMEIDNQLRTATQTREIATGTANSSVYRSTRNRYQLPDDFDYYYGQNINNTTRDMQRNRRRFESQPEQRVTTTTPAVDILYVYQQLTSSFQQLIGEYRRTLNLVERWPGGLPADQSQTMLQSYMDSAQAELDKLARYQPPYLYQNQQQVPRVQPRVRRR